MAGIVPFTYPPFRGRAQVAPAGPSTDHPKEFFGATIAATNSDRRIHCSVTGPHQIRLMLRVYLYYASGCLLIVPLRTIGIPLLRALVRCRGGYSAHEMVLPNWNGGDLPSFSGSTGAGCSPGQEGGTPSFFWSRFQTLERIRQDHSQRAAAPVALAAGHYRPHACGSPL